MAIDVRGLLIDTSGTARVFPLGRGPTPGQAAMGLPVGHEPSGDAIRIPTPWQGDATAVDPLDWQPGVAVGAPTYSEGVEFRSIRGRLPQGYLLAFPIPVEIRWEGEEIVVSQSDLRLHSFGDDKASAIGNFKQVLVEQLERLTRYEDRLSPALEGDLRLLRALLRRDA